MAFTQISTDGIKNGTITGSDFATNIDLTDSQKIRFGNSQDLNIYHDGTNSFITNATNDLTINSTGDDLILKAADDAVIQVQGSENAVLCNGNGSVELFYNGSKKFETTSGGAKWTGDLTCDDNNKIRIGSSGDLNLFHDGDDSIIENTTGDFEIRGAGTGVGNVLLRPKTGENGVIVKPDAGVELYYNNSLMLDVKSWGVEINGHLGLDDNRKVTLGNLPDLEIYHNGTHSFVDEVGNGNLILRTNPSGTYSTLVLQAGQQNSVICHKNGNVELYYDSVKKLETTAGGVTITGTDASDGTIIKGDLRLHKEGDAASKIKWDGSEGTDGHLEIFDDVKLTFGAGSDLQIFHDGNNSAITNATGGLYIKNDGVIEFQRASSPTSRMIIDSNGRVGINVTTLYNVFEVKNTSNSIHPARFLMVGAHQYAPIITDNDGANGSGAATFLTCRMSNSIKGDITFNGSVMVYGGTSDYRLKENVVSINDGIAKIKQLNPLRYNFIDNPSHTCEGFFAHEAQAVCPQSATGTKDEIATEDLDSAIKKGDPVYQQMDYSKLVPLLTAGLKEAIAKIETLEAEVAALKAA